MTAGILFDDGANAGNLRFVEYTSAIRPRFFFPLLDVPGQMDGDVLRRPPAGKSTGPEIIAEPFELIDLPQLEGLKDINITAANRALQTAPDP
jgi:hypothetical protein